MSGINFIFEKIDKNRKKYLSAVDELLKIVQAKTKWCNVTIGYDKKEEVYNLFFVEPQIVIEANRFFLFFSSKKKVTLDDLKSVGKEYGMAGN